MKTVFKILALVLFLLLAFSAKAQNPLNVRSNTLNVVWNGDTLQLKVHPDSLARVRSNIPLQFSDKVMFSDIPYQAGDTSLVVINDTVYKFVLATVIKIKDSVIILQADTILGYNPLSDSCVVYFKVKHVASCSPLWLSSPDSVWITGDLRQIDGSVAFRGTSGDNPFHNDGTLFMWYGAKSALRAGYGNNDDWATDSIGNYSFALGYRVKAVGANSFSIGSRNRAANDSSFAIGNSNKVTADENAFAVGSGNSVKSDYGIIVGNANTINLSANQSYVYGRSNISGSSSSLLLGDNNNNGTGQNKILIGFGNNNSGGIYQISHGFNNIIDDSLNFVIGILNMTVTNARRNLLFGNSNQIADGQRNVAIGNVNTITSNKSIAIGDSNEIRGGTFTGENNYVFGENNWVSCSTFTMVFGMNNADSAAANSYIIGKYDTIDQFCSDVAIIGTQNTIHQSTSNGYIIGANSAIFGGADDVYLIGRNLFTNKPNQAVIGQYNDSTSNALFIVGNGTGVGAESNALEVYADSVVKTPGKFVQYYPDHAFLTYSNNTGYPVQIDVQGAWMDATDSTADRLTDDESNGFTYINDTLQYNGYTKAHIKFTVSISISGTNTHDFIFRVYNVTDGSPISVQKHITTTGATNRQSVTLLGYDHNANPGDKYIIQVQNNSAAADVQIFDFGIFCDVTHYVF